MKLAGVPAEVVTAMDEAVDKLDSVVSPRSVEFNATVSVEGLEPPISE